MIDAGREENEERNRIEQMRMIERMEEMIKVKVEREEEEKIKM